MAGVENLGALRNLEGYIEGFLGQPRFTSWRYGPKDDDTVWGMTFLRCIEPGKERRLVATQWLGREAFWGEVRYSIRDIDDGPLLGWPAGTEDLSDVVLYDLNKQKKRKLGSEPVELAGIAVASIPCDPVIWETAPRADFIERLSLGYLRAMFDDSF